MTEPAIEFPLSLRPVVRSRQPRDPQGSFVPYHAAVWIIDATGRSIVDVAPDLDDLRGGRTAEDAHALVDRASRMVGWLERVHARLAALAAPFDTVPLLRARPFLRVNANDRTAELGVQLVSSENEAFDCLSRRVDLFASDAAVDAIVNLLSGRLSRRYSAASETLQAVREAIDAWRSTEEVAASGADPVVIDDVRLEN